MLKKILKIIYLFFFVIFITLVTTYYFSEENILRTNKSRDIYAYNLVNDEHNLILLENDTKDIIEYKDEVENFKKNKKKYKFWDLLKK